MSPLLRFIVAMNSLAHYCTLKGCCALEQNKSKKKQVTALLEYLKIIYQQQLYL